LHVWQTPQPCVDLSALKALRAGRGVQASVGAPGATIASRYAHVGLAVPVVRAVSPEVLQVGTRIGFPFQPWAGVSCGESAQDEVFLISRCRVDAPHAGAAVAVLLGKTRSGLSIPLATPTTAPLGASAGEPLSPWHRPSPIVKKFGGTAPVAAPPSRISFGVGPTASTVTLRC
jgi:hypothetical protein